MLTRFRDLLALRIATGHEERHRVVDVLVDDALSLAYVVAEFRDWGAKDRTLVRAADFGRPDMAAGVWPTHLGSGDIRPAPEADDSAHAAETEALRCAGIERAECSVGPGLFEDGADLPSGRIHSLERLMGATVEGTDREAGSLMDVIVDFDVRRVCAMVVKTGEHQRVAPVSLFDAPDWSARSLRLRSPVAQLDASPDLHEVPLERKWWNAVLAYYGIA